VVATRRITRKDMAAEKNEYASYIPLIQKMINSFEIPNDASK
jgi:hypothetical protein